MWITLTDNEVLPPGKERASIAAIKTVDDLANIIQRVTDTFRGAIAGRGYALGDDGTIPSQVAPYVSAMALWMFLTQGVPKNDSVQTKSREAANADALSVLRSISEGKFGIEPPAGFTGRSSATGSFQRIPGRLGMNI